MVLEHHHEYGSQWEAISSVAEKLGPTPETVRNWVRRAEVNGGVRPGVTDDERPALLTSTSRRPNRAATAWGVTLERRGV